MDGDQTMRFRKNKKRIDPRYFLDETASRDEIEEQLAGSTPAPKSADTKVKKSGSKK